MNFRAYQGEFLRKCALLLLALAIPVFATAQDKKPKPSAPPPKSAPPAHASAPAHTNAPANTGHTGMTNTGHTGTTNTGTTNTGHTGMTNTGHTGMTNTGHTNNTNTGNRPGTPATGHTGTATTGHTAAAMKNPGKQLSLKGGGTASIRANGQIRSVNRNGMQIQHGIHGGRTVVSTHNGARVVTTGKNGGYVQRAYVVRNGRTYVSRTYVVNNVTYTNVYRSYGYGGYCCYYGYAPAYYYHPGYYGWAYNPWPAPVAYSWGWGGAPWYGYYGPYYYQPYPVYPAAYFWLTDWWIAASLQSAYAAQAEANAKLSPMGPDFPLVASMGMMPAPEEVKVVMTKEVKDLLAEEVKAQLAEDQTASGTSGKTGSASGGAGSSGGQASTTEPPPALDPKRRTFVVADEVSTTADGEECSLTSGDVISRVTDTPDDDKNLQAKVLASKKNDCAVGKQVDVSLEDLQEMHNHFREQITGGMDELSKKNGSGGLPKAPDTGKQDGEVPAPAADSSAAKNLKDQQSAADQTEADVKQEAGSPGGGGSQ